MRLLYVAITRSILHCSIGIAPIIKRRFTIKKQIPKTDLYQSALGYLLKQKKKSSYEDLKISLYNIQKKNVIEISEREVCLTTKTREYPKLESIQKIHEIHKTRNILHPWKRISFSKLNKKNTKKNINYNLNIINNFTENKKNNSKKVFLYGAEYGIFLHNILKNINFSKPENIKEKIKNFNYLSLSTSLINKIDKLINTMIFTLLKNFKISLIQLNSTEYTQEMNFTLPIKKYINFNIINFYIKKYDDISALCPDLSLYKISGILTGSIDLIFKWKNKFYFIDYKSNWLGSDNFSYSNKKIKLEIIKHRYDLQYQIYTLAIHRYLKNHVKNYSYKKILVELFIFFLRAFEKKGKNSGIFFKKPSYLLINKLDYLFNGILYND
nr:hypothetical protein [Buchnera aphidicola]